MIDTFKALVSFGTNTRAREGADFEPAMVKRVGESVLAGLRAYNESRRPQGDELHAAVYAVIEAHPESKPPLLAKQVLVQIPIELLEDRLKRGIPYPSIRRVQQQVAAAVRANPHLSVKVFKRRASGVSLVRKR